MNDELKGRRILVVEDEIMLRELIARALTDRGATVSRSDNGKEAWAICQSETFDAIITDVRMPGGDGLTLVRHLQARAKTTPGPNPKIFICSGFGDMEDTKPADLKVDRIFEKPFRLRDMVQSIVERI